MLKKICFYFLNFIICSIFGCIIETIWCIIKNKRYESRKGLLYGPFIPIYGVAGMILSILITELDIKNILSVFFIGVIVSTIVEFLSSYLQEKIFHSRSWDYSSFPCNLNGRVNLIYSLMFGVVAVLWYVFCYDLSLIIFNNIEFKFIKILCLILFIFIMYDMILSFIVVYRAKMRRSAIIRNNKFWKYIDKKYPDERILKAYSNMEFM